MIITAKSRISELDGIRGIAILMVLTWHYVNCQNAHLLCRPLAYITRATGMFWSGVDLFFVLSGFLIGGILVDNSHHPGFLRAFYVRRAVRILPLYVLLLCLFFVFRATLDHAAFAWLLDGGIPDLAYWSFTQNVFMGLRETWGGHCVAVTWSLAVEEQFYLIVPLVLRVAGPSRFVGVIIIAALMAPFIRLAMPGFVAWVNMPCRMDALLIGVGLAIAFRSEQVVQCMSNSKPILLAVCAVLGGGMVLMTWRFAGREFLDPVALAAFYASLICLAVVYRGARATAILRARSLMSVGKYSYGIYMYHEMVVGLMHGACRAAAPSMATLDGAILTATSLAITMVLSVASYHMYEAHFMRWGHRFKYDGVAAVQACPLAAGVSDDA